MTRGTLRAYWEQHASAAHPLREWAQQVKLARWENSSDVVRQFGKAKVLRNNRYVFKIGGNNYRLVVHIRFEWRTVFVRFIGTHAEYDKINAEEI